MTNYPFGKTIIACTLLATGSTVAAEEQCATRDDAVASIDQVSHAIEYANFLGKRGENDRLNLLIKAEAAIAKVGAYKFDDAIDKLVEISDKAIELESAPKAKLDDSSAINEAVGASVVCVNDLI